MDMQLAWNNIVKVVELSQGNAEYHKTMQESLVTVLKVLNQLEKENNKKDLNLDSGFAQILGPRG